MALDFPVPSSQTPVNTWSPTSTPSASTNGLTYLWDGEKWGSAGSTPNVEWNEITGKPDFDALYVETAGDEMSGNLTVPSLNGGPLAGFRNLLINGDFRIWQRSTDVTITAANETGVVSADRWYFSFNGRYFRRSEAPEGFRYSLQVTQSDPGINVYSLRQGVEMFDSDGNTNATPFKNNSQWTCSFWTTGDPENNGSTFRLYAVPTVGAATADQTSLAPDVTFTSTGETSNGFTRYSATATVNTSTAAGSGKMAVECFIGGLTEFGAQGRYTGFQLEPGPVATPFEHRPMGTELALCQRYYQRHFQPPARGSSQNTTQFARLGFSLPVTMRAEPTASMEGTLNWSCGSHSGKIISLARTWTTVDKIEFDCSSSEGTVPGADLPIAIASLGETGYILVDAEL